MKGQRQGWHDTIYRLLLLVTLIETLKWHTPFQ